MDWSAQLALILCAVTRLMCSGADRQNTNERSFAGLIVGYAARRAYAANSAFQLVYLNTYQCIRDFPGKSSFRAYTCS